MNHQKLVQHTGNCQTPDHGKERPPIATAQGNQGNRRIRSGNQKIYPDMIELAVSDSGPGISPEDKEKLFLPYFSTKNRGTGLGLAIVSRIVSEHGGTIRVEDNRPSGSRFLIETPAAEPVRSRRKLGEPR